MAYIQELGGEGGDRIKLGELWSQLGGPKRRLGEPPAGKALWKPVGDPRGGTRKKKKENGVFLVCGGTIGYRSLRGGCPKEMAQE